MPPTSRSAPTPIFICFFLIVSDVTSRLNALQTSLHCKLVCALSYMVSLMYMKFDAPNTSFVAGTEQVFIAMDAACFCDRELREESIDSSGEKRPNSITFSWRRAAALVQFPQFPDGVRVVFFRCHKQQDTRLITIQRHPSTPHVKISEGNRCLGVSRLDRRPELLRRGSGFLWNVFRLRPRLNCRKRGWSSANRSQRFRARLRGRRCKGIIGRMAHWRRSLRFRPAEGIQ